MSLFHHIYKRSEGGSGRSCSHRQVFGHSSLPRRLAESTTLRRHEGCVNAIDWHPQGELMLTGGDDRRICLWKLNSPKPLLLEFNTGHANNILCNRFLPSDDSLIASCSQDSTVRVHKLGPSGTRCTLVIRAHKDHVNDIQAHPNQPKILWSVGSDGSVRCFDLRVGSGYGSWFTESGMPEMGGPFGGIGFDMGPFTEWRGGDLLSCKVEVCTDSVFAWPSQSEGVFSLALHPQNENYFVIGGGGKHVRLYDQRKPPRVPGDSGYVSKFSPTKMHSLAQATSVAINHDGTHCLASYNTGEIHLLPLFEPPTINTKLGCRSNVHDSLGLSGFQQLFHHGKRYKKGSTTSWKSQKGTKRERLNSSDETDKGNDVLDCKEPRRCVQNDTEASRSGRKRARKLFRDDELGSTNSIEPAFGGNNPESNISSGIVPDVEGDLKRSLNTSGGADDIGADNEAKRGTDSAESETKADTKSSGADAEGNGGNNVRNEISTSEAMLRGIEVQLRVQRGSEFFGHRRYREAMKVLTEALVLSRGLDDCGVTVDLPTRGELYLSRSKAKYRFVLATTSRITNRRKRRFLLSALRDAERASFLMREPFGTVPERVEVSYLRACLLFHLRSFEEALIFLRDIKHLALPENISIEAILDLENIVINAHKKAKKNVPEMDQDRKRDYYSGDKSPETSADEEEEQQRKSCFRYMGHSNTKSLKTVRFWGPRSEYVLSGSDDARIFVWETKTGKLVRVLETGDQIVDIVEGHPFEPIIASSGLSVVRIWEPTDGRLEGWNSLQRRLPLILEENKNSRDSSTNRRAMTNSQLRELMAQEEATCATQ